MKNDIFYCYSKRLFYFLMSFNERYVSHGVNKNTEAEYYTFNKSPRLDEIIVLYNEVKHKIS